MIYRLKKNRLQDYINWLIEKYEVWGPAKVDEETVFTVLKNGKDFVNERTLLGPKEIIYPMNENIFSPIDFKERVVIGVRSCDLRSYSMLDDVFLGEYRDEIYETKRKKTYFINFVCNEPCEYGFCTTFYGPRLKDHFYMQFTDLGEYYLVEAIDKKLINDFFEKANNDDMELAERIESEFYKKMKPLNTKNLHKKLDWNNPLWKDFSKRCISCGACNYACPTCFCFDVYDDNEERYREWDSCILSGFSRLAGNVNPRPTLDLRLRQRFMHKLRFHYENYGYYLCTGCGRCIEVCPVNIDIRDVIRSVEK